MTQPPNSDAGNSEYAALPVRRLPFPAKVLFFSLEIAFILALLLWWILDDSIRQSKNLWVCFFYCFPAEFVVATVPHEPVILYFGKFYPAWTVALISVLGTVLTEIINYSVFGFVADLKLFKKMLESKTVRKTVDIFKRAPFLALWVAGFTPIPFYPFRFLVVLAKYPLSLYLLAVVTSRAPRMYLIALAGGIIRFPDYLLIVLMAVLIVAANFPILRKLLKKKRPAAEAPRP